MWKGIRQTHDENQHNKGCNMAICNNHGNVGDTLPVITTGITAFIKEVYMALTHSALLLALGKIFYVGGMILLFIGGMAGLGLANADMAVRMHELLAPLMALGSVAGEALGLAMNPSASSDKTAALFRLCAVGASTGLCAAILGGRLWEHALEKLPQGRRGA